MRARRSCIQCERARVRLTQCEMCVSKYASKCASKCASECASMQASVSERGRERVRVRECVRVCKVANFDGNYTQCACTSRDRE
jgi:hypothetical protein